MQPEEPLQPRVILDATRPSLRRKILDADPTAAPSRQLIHARPATTRLAAHRDVASALLLQGLWRLALRDGLDLVEGANCRCRPFLDGLHPDAQLLAIPPRHGLDERVT